jgi:hypothetical protein
MRTVSDRKPLTPPRYRVEQRVAGEPGFIVGFADTPLVYRSLLAVGAARLAREGTAGEVVAIDQDTEAVVARRDVWTPPGRRGRGPAERAAG